MTTPIAPWIMAAATRLVDEWTELQREASCAADSDESARLHLIESVSHVIWVEKQKEAAK